MRLTQYMARWFSICPAAMILFATAWAQAPQPYPQQPSPQQYPAQGYPGQGPQQQQGPEQENDPDAPNHGAARISMMNGDVSVRRGDNGDYIAAAMNAPLVVGDRVLTGPNSRAEVQFDGANLIRIGANSEIRLAELAYQRYQIQLARGLATFRVLHPQKADVEVSVPQASIRPQQQGTYRLIVRDDGESEITTRAGEVELFTPRGAETVASGKTMMLRGTASEPEFQMVAAGADDEWDRWNQERDQVFLRSASARYVSPDVYGTEDLDANGRWVADPNYGTVWAPTVPAGWAPYRAGRWVWLDYYGWTWVSYDPFGWAPYHYGSWYVRPGLGWCWYPGGIGIGVHRFWSPALVGFVGFGSGVGVGFAFGGGVGWFPLGPHEHYSPWWGHGYVGGVHSVTVINNVNVYRNAGVGGGVTTVTREGFTGGAQGHAFTGDIRSANLVRGQLPAAAGRQSMSFTNHPAAASTLSRTPNNESFFSTRAPNQVNRGVFGQGQSSSGGFNSGSVRPPVPNAGGSVGGWRGFGAPNAGGFTGNNGRTTGAFSQARPESSDRSLGRFGDPGSRSAEGTVQNRGVSAPNNSGWQKFDPSAMRQGGGNTGRISPQNGNSVRVSPPVVRERPAYSAPSRSPSPASRPAYSAPRPSNSGSRSEAPHSSGAPKSNSGGGSHSGGSHASAPHRNR